MQPWTAAAEDAAAPPRFSPEAAAVFQRRCTACHTYGKGIKVGPDLKGVTQRRERAWLTRFIRSSSEVIASGDPTAAALFSQFGRQRMPDWSDLSEQQVGAVLDYLAVGGPDVKPVDEREAETAAPGQIEHGRRLFHGSSPFQSGAQACSACHAVKGSRLEGGTLGPDLSDVYSRFRDRALTTFLRRPSGPRFHGAQGERYLAPEEAFAVKAYLSRVAETELSAGARSAR